MSKSRAIDKKIGLSKEDKAFQLNKITYLEFKHLEPERTLLYLFPRLQFDGNLGKVRNASILMTVQTFQEWFLGEDAKDAKEFEKKFQDFSKYPDVVYKWLETDLLDLINRGHPVKEAVVAPRPLHGNAYKYRNAKQARDYDSSKQLYWMLFHARQGLGQKARDDLRNYIFAGLDANTDKLDFTNPATQSQIDVETQAILHLDNQTDVAAKSDTSKPADRFEPLCIGQADLLAEDILRLLTYEKHMPRSVLIDYLKTLFSFHLGLYHLRLLKLLPALVKRQGHDPTCQRCPMAPSQNEPHGDCPHRIGLLVDMGDSSNIEMVELARRSTETHYQRITPYLHAHFTVVKLNEMADYLNRIKELPNDVATLSVGELLQLTKKDYARQRDQFFSNRLQQLLERFPKDEESWTTPQEIEDILNLKLNSMESYIEILMSQRSQYHQQQLKKCLDSLLQKNNSSGLLQQPNRGSRRFVLGSRLLEVLLQLAVLERQGGRFRTREIRIDELLEFLRERYGLYIDRLPPIDGFGEATIQDQQALRTNLETFKTRLREIGFFQDLSDAYITQTVTPRYTINI
jgi:hypothetical protein